MLLLSKPIFDVVGIHVKVKVGTFVAAQQAVSGFAQLLALAARAFIYTSNITNIAILPRFVSQGISKSGAAHMIW